MRRYDNVDEAVNTFTKINKDLYDKWMEAGYKIFKPSSFDPHTDIILCKWIWKNNRKAFYIVVHIYVYDNGCCPNFPDGHISLGPTVQFNTHAKNLPTFNVEIIPPNHQTTPQQVEEFFNNMYEKLECEPYDNED